MQNGSKNNTCKNVTKTLPPASGPVFEVGARNPQTGPLARTNTFLTNPELRKTTHAETQQKR